MMSYTGTQSNYFIQVEVCKSKTSVRCSSSMTTGELQIPRIYALLCLPSRTQTIPFSIHLSTPATPRFNTLTYTCKLSRIHLMPTRPLRHHPPSGAPAYVSLVVLALSGDCNVTPECSAMAGDSWVCVPTWCLGPKPALKSTTD